MGFTKQSGVSVLELILYFPALAVAAIVCKRHGFNRSSGFIFTLVLCIVRITGACCQLAMNHSSSKGLIEAVLILESVGLSPLLLATLGLLSRCADSIVPTSSKGMFSAIHFRIVQLVITLGMILSIAGGTSSITPSGVYQPQTTSKAGIILYLLALIALAMIGIFTAIQLSSGPKDDRRIAWVAMLALPFISIRLIYAFLAVFSNNKRFYPATGSVVIHLFMAVLEEFVVVVMFLGVGWVTSATVTAARGPIASRPWKGPLGGTRAAKGGEGGHGRGRRQGPIHALVNAGIARTQARSKDMEQGYARGPTNV
ncbi:hypothetical protein K458DRAFT_377896 [Lentithecium fluviatile CBS 122367]|uniref:DUF7702 domain-containing protein n=1 Tax=Lentithecium fluviatile CBS 122367 TaxID=1168545 RepID=A0A6G1IHM0_9PLEO|nr:hypothetical protein K458DRAFT_377896 [Lentithecium fluviatile CBS 122367]